MSTKIYITRYALSSGIEVSSGEFQGKYVWAARVGRRSKALFALHDYCLTAREATTAADQMRLRKIASLEKQIDKLRKMKFEIKEDLEVQV